MQKIKTTLVRQGFVKGWFLGVLFMLFFTTKVNAATILVTNTSDTGSGSLRHAIQNADYADKVKISPALLKNGSDTIFLKSTINITKGIFIEGTYNNKDTIFISGSDSVQIFYIQTAGTYHDCYLDSLVLIHGKGVYGGAVELDWKSDALSGELIINNCSFIRNNATYGGALASDASDSRVNENNNTKVHIFNSTFANNHATKEGGAIFIKLEEIEINGLSATLTLSNSSVIDNSAGTNGGGIYVYCNNTYSGFTVPKGASDVSIQLSRVSICRNEASTDGGGIWIFCDGKYNSDWGDIDFGIKYSTLTDNKAIGSGGAIYSKAKDISDIDIDFSTLTHNKAFNDGGSIYNNSRVDKALLNIYSSIIALNTNAAGKNNNVSNTGPNNDIYNNIYSGGNNIFDDLTMNYYIPLPNVNPDLKGETSATINLEALVLNDSGTYTRIPGVNSVAIDAGPKTTVDAQNRSIIGTRDIGAAESLHCKYYTLKISDTICAGESYNFKGKTLTQSGTYVDTQVNQNGCDTITNLKLAVNQKVAPSLTISSSLGNILFPTSLTTFMAAGVNQGLSPEYEWIKNGTNTGVTGLSYSPGVMSNGDKITCILTSSLKCANPKSATSTAITISIVDNNDEPCNASLIDVNKTCIYSYHSNSDASNTPGVAKHNCFSNTSNDVWFKFVAPPSGKVEITSLAGTLTDAVLSVYSGTCSNLFEVGCADDVSTTNKMPEATLSGATNGSTYFVRVSGKASLKGTFALCLYDGLAASNDFPDKNAISVYPNPSAGIFNLITNFTSESVNINVYDAAGRSVYRNKKFTGNTLDLSFLVNGYYHMEVVTDLKRFTTPIIIE